MTHPAIVPAPALRRYCSVALAAHEKIGPRLGVAGTSLGGRLSRHRRNRIAYLALARRSTDYTMHAWYVRVIALVTIAGLSIGSRESVLAIALCLAASLGSFLLWINERHLRRGTQPRFWLSQAYLRNVIKTDGRHRLSLGSYLEIPEAFVLIAVPSWIATDDPLWARLIMLAAGTVFLITTSLLIFNDHTWFNPDEMDPPAWHEIFRRLAGPITALPVCLIALPADWSPNGWLAALAISLMPLAVVGSRISDTDLIMKALPDLVQAESHTGRELVISETHGALSTHLRLIEQRAREVREVAPSLYELAVSAHSRLRETLTLAQLGRDSSTSVQNLEAPVLTLARAVGAKAEVEISVDTLSGGDRDLARLLLNDLVGNALNAGASAIHVTLAPVGAQVAISVTDDAPPMADGVWKTPGTSSAWLEARLGDVSGSLTSVQNGATKTVTARWLPESE
jgi:signal transduction histidine kinase